MEDLWVVHTTVPTRDLGMKLREQILTEKLAASGQMIGPIDSAYWWQGRQCQAQEWQLRFQIQSHNWRALKKLILSFHPYEVPEIYALPMVATHGPYGTWVKENSKGDCEREI